MSPKKPVTVAELYAAYNAEKDAAKVRYDKADSFLRKLVRAWKKNKQAKIDDAHVLEIEDQFRGATKAFAPGFAHRYKLKERAIAESGD
jgi:NH3-dependent NAD+ synthetase